MRVSFCVSLGCSSPRSLSLFGRGTGAPQSGIHNLWAAGPCQGAAATQHVSTPQGARPPAACFFFLFVPPSIPSFFAWDDFRTRLLAALKIFPLWCPELLATFHHLCNHIYSSTGQGWNLPQKGKIQSHSFPSAVWSLHQCFITRLSTAQPRLMLCIYSTANNKVPSLCTFSSVYVKLS